MKSRAAEVAKLSSSAEQFEDQVFFPLLDKSHFHAILEHSPLMVCSVDAHYRYQMANRAYCEWVNVDIENLLDLKLDVLGNRSNYPDYFEALDVAKREGRNYEFEARHPDGNGNLQWYKFFAVPQSDQKDCGLFLYIENIDVLKRHQEKEVRLQRGVSEAMDGFSMHDAEGLFNFVNQSEADMYGYTKQELIGTSWKVLYSQETVSQIEQVYFKILVDQGSWHGELTGKKKDGTFFDVEVSLTLLTDIDGSADGLVCNCRDISSRKEIEEELRLAATVFDSSAEGVLISDNENKIIVVNRIFTELTGFRAADVEHLQVNKMHCPIESGDMETIIHNSINESGKWEGEICYRTRDRGTLYAWQTVAPVFDDKGHIHRYVHVFSDISSVRQSQERLYQIAHYDHLTGLPNRSLMEQRLNEAIELADTTGKLAAILFIDLDNFKQINDSLGHAIGDDVLCAVAMRIQEQFRDSDTIARQGGDEFTVVLASIKSKEDAELLASQLLLAFSEPLTIDGQDYFQNISVGISVYPNDGCNSVELMQYADAAMYYAKASGKGRAQFYTAEMRDEAKQLMDLDTHLRRALQHQEFILHYQPLINLNSGQVFGFEALIRWQHPSGELYFPDKFITHAEQTGLIVDIGSWVLKAACEQARQWLDAGMNVERIAVNVSGVQLQYGFVEEVQNVLEITGLPAHCLELEITETYLMAELNGPVDLLDQLSLIGVNIAIDDFGIGHSSLARLKQLPIDRLKIDRMFIKDIDSCHDDQSIVQAIIALSQALDIEVTVEGVEAAAHQELLRSYGELSAQGYFYSKPVPVSETQTLWHKLNGDVL